MALLTRFRRPGGFAQLLQLIETCEPNKQKNLLVLVSQEDPGWAHLVRTKSITTERIFSWPTQVLLEIIPKVPEKVAAALFCSLNNEQRMKFLDCLSMAARRNLQDSMAMSTPTSTEQNAARIRMIHLVRSLESEGVLKFQTFDPVLLLDNSIAA